jgi:hypothetical protein
MKVIYRDEKYLTVYHNIERNYIHLKWRSFDISLNEIVVMHKSILDYAKKNKCAYYIADSAKAEHILRSEIIGWWRSIWIPEMNKAGIRAIITVTPQNSYAKLSTKEWQLGDYKTISLVNVDSLDEAEEIIHLMNSTTVGDRRETGEK